MKSKIEYLLIVFCIFLPPAFIFLAEKSSGQYEKERFENQTELKIKRTFHRLETSKVGEKNLYREFSGIREQKIELEQSVSTEKRSEVIHSFTTKILKDLIERQNLNMQGQVMTLKQNRVVSEFVGNDCGLKQVTMGFDNPDFFNDSTGFFRPEPQKTFRFPEDKFLRDFATKRMNRQISHLSIRSPSRVRTFFRLFLGNDQALLCLLDDADFFHHKQLKKLLAEASEDIWYGAFSKKNGKIVFPSLNRLSPESRSKISEIFRKADQNMKSLKVGNLQIQISPGEKRLNRRFFAIYQEFATPPPNYFLIFFSSLFSCIIFIILTERYIFDRGINLSLRVLIPLIFVFIVIQPVFAGFFYLEDYFHNRFSTFFSSKAIRLNQALKSLDTKTLDTFTETVNLARSLNSIEKINKFLGSGNVSDSRVLCKELLLKLEKFQSGKRYHSLWFSKSDGSFTGYQWAGDVLTEKVEQNSTYAGIFQFRFKEISDFLNNNASSASSKIDKNTLAADFARDFMINMLGPDSYYDFRRNSEFILEVQSNLKKDYIFCIPYSFRNRIEGFMAWQIQSMNVRESFPEGDLSLAYNSPRIIHLNNDIDFYSAPLPWPRLKERFPKLSKLADETNLTRSRGTVIFNGKETIRILDSMLANHSVLAIAGAEEIPNYDAYRKMNSGKIYIKLLATVFFGIFVAILAAMYFISPVKELTVATSEIEAGNFGIRLEEKHPDDFSEISRSFNLMAQRLQEGKILQGYVSESVKKEILSGNHEEIVDKAELKTSTVLFSGIKNFKKIIKTMNATEVVNILQTHLKVAVEATLEFGGEIDKMIEDKVMIVFEHNSDEECYAEAAIKTAITISRLFEQQSSHTTVAGINSGLTVAGIMGAEKARLARTVIGDPVNLAARLATEADKGGYQLVVSEAIVQQMPTRYVAKELPITSVKGKTQSIKAFEILLKKDLK